jgi:CHAT domain-containing protein
LTRQHQNPICQNDKTASPIVFYSPYFPDSNIKHNYQKRLPPLNGANKETQQLYNKYYSQIRAENTSTESYFKTIDKDARVIHLATHGQYNNNISNNAIVFSNKDRNEDGLLHFWEILNLEMNSDLVFLASCYSGSGIDHPGAGTFSIAYAFVGAGCLSVIACLWNLPDNNPSGIVERFYYNVYDGKSNANALREAKLYNLQYGDNLSSHPYYWAGYVFYGEDKKTKIALRQTGFIYNLEIILVFVMLIMLETYILIKKAHNKYNYKQWPPC